VGRTADYARGAPRRPQEAVIAQTRQHSGSAPPAVKPPPPAASSPRQVDATATGGDEALPFPRYSVALVQDESEMLQVPTSDLSGFLEHDPHWYVELVSERGFDALLHSVGRFDCIVLGYNAVHKSSTIRKALDNGLPDVGLCVLHQRRPPALSFLRGDVAADLVDLGERHPVEHAASLVRESEILLHWPVPLSDLDRCEALCALAPGDESSWRTVLEVTQDGIRRPVLMRTHTGRRPGVVVSTLLLDPGIPAHRALIDNMIMWCAAGRPEAVIFGDPRNEATRRMHHKLHLQGTTAVIEPPPPRGTPIDFRRWPQAGVRDAIVDRADDPTAAPGWFQANPGGVRNWLRRGGRLVRADPEGVLTVTHGARYLRWVAIRWTEWFMSHPPESWHGPRDDGAPGSIVATRAVLRVLQQLKLNEDPDFRVEQVGLKPVTEYREPVARLLEARLAGMAHCDGTVSATAAALELGRWLDALDLGHRDRIKDWLLDEYRARRKAGTAFEDRLEIARCLEDPGLLRDTLAGPVPPVLSAVMVNRLREAVVACGARADDVAPEIVRTESTVGRARGRELLGGRSVVERELDTSPLLASSYLTALRRVRDAWGDETHPLLHPRSTTVDRAVASVARHGRFLSPDLAAGPPDHEEVCTETLALLTYFHSDPLATQVLEDAQRTLPPSLVASVLQESQRLRAENAAIPKLARLRTRARNLLGAAAVLVAGAITSLVSVVAIPSFSGILEFVAPAVALPLALLALFAGLARWDLAPGWGRKLAVGVNKGIAGLRASLSTRLEGTPDDEGRAGSRPPGAP
jgi:hypothetical protein